MLMPAIVLRTILHQLLVRLLFPSSCPHPSGASGKWLEAVTAAKAELQSAYDLTCHSDLCTVASVLHPALKLHCFSLQAGVQAEDTARAAAVDAVTRHTAKQQQRAEAEASAASAAAAAAAATASAAAAASSAAAAATALTAAEAAVTAATLVVHLAASGAGISGRGRANRERVGVRRAEDVDEGGDEISTGNGESRCKRQRTATGASSAPADSAGSRIHTTCVHVPPLVNSDGEGSEDADQPDDVERGSEESDRVVGTEDLIDPMDMVWQQLQARSAASSPEGELHMYLSEGRAAKGTDELQWWSECGYHLPSMREMAREYLAVPCTSVLADYAFEFDRNRLPPSMMNDDELQVNIALCLKSWNKHIIL